MFKTFISRWIIRSSYLHLLKKYWNTDWMLWLKIKWSNISSCRHYKGLRSRVTKLDFLLFSRILLCKGDIKLMLCGYYKATYIKDIIKKVSTYRVGWKFSAVLLVILQQLKRWFCWATFVRNIISIYAFWLYTVMVCHCC